MLLGRPKIVILDDRYEDYKAEKAVLDVLNAEIRVAMPECPEQASALLSGADGVLCNLYQLNAELIGSMTKCRVISRYGVGYDNVDVSAAAGMGIAVCNVPDYAMEDASDHALALLLNCVRKISYRDRMVRRGEWNLHRNQPSFRMAGKTVGIIGYGRIGSCFVRKISGFGFARILVCDPTADEGAIRDAGAEKVDLTTVLQASDYLSLHCPLNSGTKDMIDDRALSMMKSGAILINTARGPIVNEQALTDALCSGRIAAAGLDVYDEDPLRPESPLRSLDNVTLTDHAAWYSEESIEELKSKAAQNIVDELEGRISAFRVN